MAGTYQTFKFSYNTTVDELVVETQNVNRVPDEYTVVRVTPTGEKYKQVFGSGKYRWAFAFPTLTAREILTIFNNAYDAQLTEDITFSEEQDDGSFADYTVIINRPVYSPDTLDSTTPIDRALSVEVIEA